MTEEKNKFGFKVLVGLWRTKIFVVLVLPLPHKWRTLGFFLISSTAHSAVPKSKSTNTN